MGLGMGWRERISRAAQDEDGMFTEEDKDLASDWVDCACGQQDPRIPRDSTGRPTDERLAELGLAFYNAVEEDDFKRAGEVLEAIEDRSAWILGQLPPEDVFEDIFEGRTE